MLLQFQKIQVDKHAEAGFRRRALKAYPKEYIETLWGYIRDGVAYVCVFMPLKHTSTPHYVDYDHIDLRSQHREAQEYELEVLGSIHTHPDRDDAIFSENDLRELQEQDNPEKIMAICAIEKGKRRKLRISYWPGVLPMQVEYTNWGKQ